MGVRTRDTLTKYVELEVPADVYKSPDGEQTVFKVIKADNRAVLARQDLFDEVRYVTRSEDGVTETIRSFPMGQLRLATIGLVLKNWNLRPAKDAPEYPITDRNMQELLAPEELDWIYTEIIEMNPVWGGTEAGED